MHIPRRLIQDNLLVSVLTIIVTAVFYLAVNDAEAIDSVDNEAPIYEIPISDSTQQYIWKICEVNEFSYELILSVYKVEGFDNIKHGDIKSDIGTLVYYRDYWAKQGYPDEFVFDLILISRLRGIEGCWTFLKHTESYDLNDYVQAVSEYKFYLEQSLDVTASNNILQNSSPVLAMD